MSSLSNINNNSAVINVGRTTPVNPGPQPAASSIPVVLAEDQTPIPVVEQNKIQSEVALSLLGIPRSEVALGIFADVNTYDVNPAEWSTSPPEYIVGHGIKHLSEEAGALVEAPKNEVAVLTSKRFFRYQPGRVSAATFGVKCSLTPSESIDEEEYNLNGAIRKYGIFDQYDGYYWETRADGVNDRFVVVRRTQSLLKYNPVPFNSSSGQQQDYAFAGKGNALTDDQNLEPTAIKLLVDNRFQLAANAFTAAVAVGGTVATYLNSLSDGDRLKCLRDMDFAIDAYILDLQYGGNAHSIVNATTYGTAILNNGPAEREVHIQLRDGIKSFLTGSNETSAEARITALSAWTINAVGGTPPTQNEINNAVYAQRSKISTVFSIYNRYFGYLVSESMSYVENPDSPLDIPEIKNRCLRDVVYVIDGYSQDLEFGGNSGTVFNAKNYYYDGIQVYSQTVGGTVAEVARHQYLKSLISSTSNVTVKRSNGSNISIPSAFTKFGLSNFKTRFDVLADLIVNNFTTEYTGPANFGSAPQFGNLVIYRDNLLMIHAAAYDPSLLKPKKQVAVRINVTDNTIEAAEGSFVVGQYINFKGNAGGLVNDKLYVVLNASGPKGNIIKVGDPKLNPTTVVDITTIGTNAQYIEPNVPFIFPTEYSIGETPEDPVGNFIRPDGMFPYLYTQDGILPASIASKTVGFIDTAIRTDSDAATLKQQIDRVNLRWNNWIKQNVDPKYYSVYEFRIPRSRFSTDQLNGKNNKVVYSDIATSVTGKAYAGQPVIDNGGIQLENKSAWEIDFTKVVMLKIEFSWYGAVGALFLAYVPVANGEARWVRVHHLRASNQLKIPSLGNATLPITYLVYGGGTVNKLGIADATDKSYGSASEHIVKYGASYYIDGGDRGTVRLYSYSNDDAVETYGSKFVLGSVSLTSDAIGYYIDVSGVAGLPVNKVFFMNAKLVTSSRQDQNVEIVWISGTKLYINRSSLISTNGVFLVAARSSVIFGLKSKENIFNTSGVGVRNRVQVYPTKLSTSNLSSSPVKMKVLKTPYYQPVNVTSGAFELTAPYEITTLNLPLPTSSTSYLSKDGEFVYVWAIANVGTVFGKLYKDDGLYYFSLLQTYSVPVILLSTIAFLKEQRFDFEGNLLTAPSESIITKERLSSVFVSTEIQSPIPKTGTEITSFFLKPGSDQFDLLGYFDYNKDYLSFPLTNQVESLYLICDNANATGALGGINASLTWEEQ
jgi:hypothetical protein